MNREYVDAVPRLRKYRIFTGQGIPDPWTTFTHFSNNEIYSYPEDSEKALRCITKNNKKECCLKKYLFKCPDQCPSNSHCSSFQGFPKTKNPSGEEIGERCRCSEIFHNWLLERVTQCQKKKEYLERGPEGDLSSDRYCCCCTDADDAGKSREEYKIITICECCRNQTRCDSGESENSGFNDGVRNEKRKKRDRGFKKETKNSLCPYFKNFCDSKPSKLTSKEIQTENLPAKFSKTIQTEKAQMKELHKCTCFNKCYYHNSCQDDMCKKGCPALNSIPNFCCSPNTAQCPPYICPYSFATYCCTQKINSRINKQKKKKQHKDDEESNIKSHQKDPKRDADNSLLRSTMKEDTQEKEAKAHNIPKFTQRGTNPANTSDHLKYLSDFKQKGFLQQEDGLQGTFQQNLQSCSKFINFHKRNPSLYTLRLQGPSKDKFKCSYYNPKYSESSFGESKINIRQSNLFTSGFKKYNLCDKATMMPDKQVENKEIIKSEESGTCGIFKVQKLPKSVGKHQKLSRSRKRRKKVAANERIKITGHPKHSEEAVFTNKKIQIVGPLPDYLKSNKIYLVKNVRSPLTF